jgi:5-aminolevulinate synthase
MTLSACVGLYGPNGGGIAGCEGLSHRLTIIESTLAKAFGMIGGYAAASASSVAPISSRESGVSPTRCGSLS